MIVALHKPDCRFKAPVFEDAPFPLTPALSLGEREPRRPVHGPNADPKLEVEPLPLHNPLVALRPCVVALKASRRGSVLVGLLWCVALLAVMVIGVLHSAQLDLRVTKNQGDLIQAHYLALAGVEKAKALLYHDAGERKRRAKNHTGELYDAPRSFKDVRLGRGQFRVFHQGDRGDGGKILYGVSAEEGRLNINNATQDQISKLYNMTPDIAAAILDWRDGNSQTLPNGAEKDYYASLRPPYVPRNGPFQTIRELLMVRGISRELLLGEDANDNGLLDPEEDDARASFPDDNQDGILDAGWSGILTTDSSAQNENAAGEKRVNIQSADERTLSRVPGISEDLAKAIVAYRGQKEFQSLADLLDVTAVNPQQQNQQLPSRNAPTPARGRSQPSAPSQATPAPSGPKLISESLLMDIADDLTVADDEEQAGVVSINSAMADVLACLPGATKELAEAIVAYRQSAGFFPNVAWLLKVDGMTAEIFKQMAPKICARSETFRILSEGTVTSTGTRKRLEFIVRLGAGTITTLGYREDL